DPHRAGPDRPLWVPRPAPASRAIVEFGAFGQATQFRLGGQWLLGGGLRFDYGQSWWAAGLDAAGARADEGSELGTIRTVLGHMSPYAAGRWAQGPLSLRAGAGYALGVAQIAGSAADARGVSGRVTGLWGSPYTFLDLGWAVTPALSLDLRGQ